MLSKKEFKKEDLLSALQELDCSMNCPCCEYFSPDDIQKCQDPTPYAVDLLEEFIQDVFNPQPYKFEDLKKGMLVWDNQLKWCFEIAICKVEIKGYENLKMFKVKNYDDSLTLMIFEKNRFYPVQMANVRCE